MLLKNNLNHIHVSGYWMLNVGGAIVETTVPCGNGDRIELVGVRVGEIFLR